MTPARSLDIRAGVLIPVSSREKESAKSNSVRIYFSWWWPHAAFG